MSKWMSIGFDPDQMDPAPAPSEQAAISGARNDAAPGQIGGLDQATSSESVAVSGRNDSTTRGIAGAIKHLVARHRTPGVSAWKL